MPTSMRIDATSQDDREKLKQEIRDEIRRDAFRRQALGCGCSVLVFLALTVLPAAYVAAQLAKTGFVDVPLFSRHLFHRSEPSREVLPLAGTPPDAMAKVIAAGATYEPKTQNASVRISEAQLTTIVNDALRNAPTDIMPFRVTSAQVAVDADAVELFLVTPQDGRDSTVKVRFVPGVRDGAFVGDVLSMEVGSFVVPDRIADGLFSAFGAYALSSVQSAIAGAGTLQSIDLAQGSMTFVIHVTPR